MQRLIFLTAIQWTCSCDLGVASSDIGLISLTMGSWVFRAVANGGGGARGAAVPPGPVEPDGIKSVDEVVFFRLSYCDYSDLQLFAIFMSEVDFSETCLMTSAEDSVSGPPNLNIFWGRWGRIPPDPFTKARAFGTRDNVPPPHPRYKKPSYGPRFVGLTHKNGSFFSYTKIGSRLIQFECTCKCTTRLSADWTFWVQMGVC